MDFSLFIPNILKILSKYWQVFLLTGLKNTLLLTIISVALGIIFGLYPAIKASGLQPVVALRAD